MTSAIPRSWVIPRSEAMQKSGVMGDIDAEVMGLACVAGGISKWASGGLAHEIPPATQAIMGSNPVQA